MPYVILPWYKRLFCKHDYETLEDGRFPFSEARQHTFMNANIMVNQCRCCGNVVRLKLW